MGPEGTVVSWSWMPEPLAGQPLAEPFAWALIRLDGADTAMLHAVDAGSAAAMRTGPAGPAPVGRTTGGQHPGHRLLRAVRRARGRPARADRARVRIRIRIRWG